ncbi:hypothetical protein ACFV29_25875 [Streptomyces sp. NPDC059690]|uniref:hypothetical protein n=1 Tax=Streptomyces sp. NPDC059690 TaxID=3346907 RepID=UPI0036C8FD50
MGIRMLNRRTAKAQAHADPAPAEPSTPVPVFAADASTARIPTDLATTLHRRAKTLRRTATALHRTATALRRTAKTLQRTAAHLAGLLTDRLPRRPGPR